MKRNVWDFLFWMLLGLALLIIFLKIIGVINTPDFILYLPIISVVFAAGIAYQRLISSVDRIYKRTDWLKDKVSGNEDRIVNLEQGQEEMLGLLKKK